MDINKKETIKHCIAISILIIIISIVAILIIRYQVDGETNMPFNLSKITIISTAEGVQAANVEGQENTKWNLSINQSNDVYFFIDKNEEYKKSATIDNISIENIKVSTIPLKGEVKTYMPNSADGRKFIYNDTFLVNEKLTYTGAKASNEKTLEIGNQGGKALIRFANTNICTYNSNEDIEVVHDGTLIAKTDTKNEEIQFAVNFDFIITSRNIKYKANITLDFPYGDILEEGTTEIEKTDMNDIIFKRIK